MHDYQVSGHYLNTQIVCAEFTELAAHLVNSPDCDAQLVTQPLKC